MKRADLYTRLLYKRSSRIFGRLAYILLKALGAEVPRSVRIGEGCLLVHGGFGVVIHPDVTLGERVKIYPGVTLGRADIYRDADKSHFEGIQVGSDVILAPGAKVLGRRGVLRIGDGAVIGANAVVLEDVGENEIWAGVPARRVGTRGH